MLIPRYLKPAWDPLRIVSEMYKQHARLTTLFFVRDIGLSSLKVVEFGEDDVRECPALARVCRQHRVKRFHVIFINFLGVRASCRVRNALGVLTHNFLDLLCVLVFVLLEVEIVVIFGGRAAGHGQTCLRVLGIVVLVVKFLLLELFLLVARELEDAARGLGV